MDASVCHPHRTLENNWAFALTRQGIPGSIHGAHPLEDPGPSYEGGGNLGAEGDGSG